MCDFVDAIKRPLSIPPRFVAYLEKHKIYELFQELAKQLIIDQPEDHILYMKQCLEHAVKKRDIPRIILLAPPIFDKMALAEILQKELGLQPITVENLREKIMNKDIEIGIRSIEELGKDCITLTKIKKHSGAPSLFRIALIGSRGSGCRTLAKYLAKRFDLIDVDFKYIMKQACLQETPIGEVLRLYEHNWNQKLKTRIQVIDNYIKKPECLSRGWVLTNYPVTVEDFKLLDKIDTPPNKVIFVQVSEEIRKERLLNHRYNIITGSKHNLISYDDYKNKCDCELGVHPKDYVNVVAEEIREYDNNVGEMLEYAGESAFIIDGNADERSVRESVEGCLMQSKMYSKLRELQPTPKIDPRDVEFDPDDEPDISIFDTIMPPEFKYSFI